MTTELEKIMQEQQRKREEANAPRIFPIQRAAIAKAEMQMRFIKDYAWQCCLNCESWSDGKTPHHIDKIVYPMGCVTFKAMPPVEVLVVGCKEHMHDIPF